MTPTHEPTTEPTLQPEKEKAKFDAKRHLELVLPRQSGDIVKVFQIPQTHCFRVNWYDTKAVESSAIPGLNVTFIRESKFVSCVLDESGKPKITYRDKQ